MELSDAQLELCSAMVASSARELTPQEYEREFAQYDAVMLRLRRPPGFNPRSTDASAAGSIDMSVFVGVSLPLLGQIAWLVMGKLIDLGVENAVEKQGSRVTRSIRRLFRRPAAGSSAQPDPGRLSSETIDDIATRVCELMAKSNPAIPAEVVRTAAQSQLTAYQNARSANAPPDGTPES